MKKMLLRSFFCFVSCQKMLINRIYLLVILLTGWVQVDLTGQESMLKGRVLDAATGDAVVGANVFDPIRQTGTITDQKGIYYHDSAVAGSVGSFEHRL
ncbi:MAG: hypothetical protein H6577_18970 [Lewinellaceae bacterium]|nr:hypothetical protein [Lewinellaceae bacterium]